MTLVYDIYNVLGVYSRLKFGPKVSLLHVHTMLQLNKIGIMTE